MDTCRREGKSRQDWWTRGWFAFLLIHDRVVRNTGEREREREIV